MTQKSNEQWPAAVVVIVLHLCFAALTWRDIAQRPAEMIHGPKGVWRAASAINSIGSIAYWLWGRGGSLRSPEIDR